MHFKEKGGGRGEPILKYDPPLCVIMFGGGKGLNTLQCACIIEVK
jgi:hypothetical protein